MHQEAITSKAREIFDNIRYFPLFYLAGGTGLALQLGHRISIDFDFFWEKYIPKDLLPKVRKVFKNSKIEVVVNYSEQLTVAVSGINASFCRYPFPVILKFISYQGIKILPALEIAAMKAYALGRRAILKDYVDLYFILKEKICNLEEIIKICQKKYGEDFDSRLFLEQLIFSKDVEEMEIQFLKEKVNKLEIEKFFEKEIKKMKI